MGKRVTFFSSQDKREKFGTLRYYGRPEFADGWWCGVELDRPEGRNNGSKHGIRYFTCQPAYGVFVPVERVERDTTRRSRSRPNSRPSSRPNSRPSSAERGRKGAQTESNEVSRIASAAAVQQELARLAQTPVTDQLTKRKAAPSSVINRRQPLKAFARSKDDATISKQSVNKVPVLPFRTRTSGGGLHRAASSENLQGLKGDVKSVKKSSSERNLQAGNTLPRKARKSSQSRQQSESLSLDKDSNKHWPRVSTPHSDEQEGGSVSVDGAVTSSHSSNGSSRDPSPNQTPIPTLDNGFVATPAVIMNSGLSTHASQLAELEKHSVGLCRIPSPDSGQSKEYLQNKGSSIASHPLSVAVEQPQAIMQLLAELVDQNQELRKRQGWIVCK